MNKNETKEKKVTFVPTTAHSFLTDYNIGNGVRPLGTRQSEVVVLGLKKEKS